MNQCQDCRNKRRSWRDCPSVPAWFSPSSICYCPHQIEWILANLTMLKSGYWPPEGKETGYYDTGGRKVRRGGAYFEIPIAVASDVEMRLDMCGPDGVLAKQCLSNGWDEGTLADIMNKPLHVIQAKIRRVINYCSGGRARVISYYEFSRRRGIVESYRA